MLFPRLQIPSRQFCAACLQYCLLSGPLPYIIAMLFSPVQTRSVRALKKNVTESKMFPKQEDPYPVKIFFLQFDWSVDFYCSLIGYLVLASDSFPKFNFFPPFVNDP